MRVKRGVAAHAKHKKLLNKTKGMQHYRRRSFRLGKQGVIKALQYSYRDRRNRKRDLRALWITRINNASRELGLSYSQLIAGMKAKNISLDRKILADLAVNNPEAFKANVKMPPAGHFGDPETEIGRVCVQLASPDFKYMNGETLTLEGGMGLRP